MLGYGYALYLVVHAYDEGVCFAASVHLDVVVSHTNTAWLSLAILRNRMN